MNNGTCKLGIDFCLDINKLNYNLSPNEWCKCNNLNEFLQIDKKDSTIAKCTNTCQSKYWMCNGINKNSGLTTCTELQVQGQFANCLQLNTIPNC